MKRHAPYILLLILAFAMISHFSYAQQFQWVKGGGTSSSSSYLSNRPEGTYYMCTDQNNNLYTLSIVGNNAIHADTFYRAGGYGTDLNLLVSSYNCSGQMRWAKLIGSSAGFSYPLGLVVDSFGHLYTACSSPNGTLHIGNDTAISGSLNKVLNLVMFDTLGHFNWIYQVGNNTPANRAATYTAYASLTLDNANNVHLIPYIGVGAVLTPTVTSHFGNYDMKFNSSGTLLSAKRLQLDSTIAAIGGTIDRQNNTFYAYGYRSFSFPDSSYYCFIAAFDTSGNRKWVDTFSDPLSIGGEVITGIAPDGNGHLYVAGCGHYYVVYGLDTLGPPPGSPYGWNVSFILKTDTSGNLEWSNRCNGNSVNDLDGVTLMPGNKVASIGSFIGKLTCGTDSINNVTSGSDAFLYIVDTAGNSLTLKQLHGNGYQDYGRSIASDRLGNLYLGGTVEDSIPNTIIPAYHSVGGNTDFFILKYGLPCDCVSPPAASFTTTGTNPVSCVYTGTTLGLDSVVWYWGDGTSDTGLTTSHTYITSDTFHICQFTYSYCGTDSTCTDVIATGVGINDPANALTHITIYPTPTAYLLNISGITTTTRYRLFSLTGTTLQDGTLQTGNYSLNISNLPPGVYLLQFSNDNGARTTARVIKQ